MNKNKLESTSKFLSLILRHAPETVNLQLDQHGWANVAELLEKSAAHGKAFTRLELEEVIATSDKKRFALSEDGLSIRANQGHSVAVSTWRCHLDTARHPVPRYRQPVCRLDQSQRLTRDHVTTSIFRCKKTLR
jgi:RNA:NAD 2'-phosphotransferase (TPT1/KptA family)